METHNAVQRRLLECLVLAGLVASSPQTAAAAGAASDTRGAEVAALCEAAKTSLDAAISELVRLGDGYRPSLAEARSHLREAASLLREEGWPDEDAVARRRLTSMLRALEARLTRVGLRSAAGEVPHLRRALRGVASRMAHTAAFLQEVAPQPPAEPLSNANPAPAAPAPAPSANPPFTWTSISPSSDSRIVYVSATRPDDSGDGLSPATAKKTLAAGYGLLRDGYPDWMLLKKGDSWTEDLIRENYGKSGRSASEPLVITSYGTGARPRIVYGACFTNRTSNFALIDLAFDVASVDDPQPWKVFGTGGGSNLLIEGCYYARGGISMSGVSNVKFRGNVVVDAWHTSGAVGAYLEGVNNLLVEGCVFDHNGWREPNIERSWFTHNIYIQVDCSNVTVRNNIFARGSGEACMQRPGGVNENNLCLESPFGITWGYGAWTFEQSHAPGVIRNNVILGACDLTAGVPRGVGITVTNAADLEISGNIIAHQTNATWGMGITPGGDLQNVSIRNNIVYKWVGKGNYDGATIGIDVQGNWRGAAGSSAISGNTFNLSRGLTVNVGGNSPDVVRYSGNTYYNGGPAGAHFRYWGADKSDAQWPSAAGEQGAVFAQPNYKDPNRTIATYMTTLSKTASLEAFLAEARQQSKSNWRPEFTAAVVNDYIRDGFTIQGQ